MENNNFALFLISGNSLALLPILAVRHVFDFFDLVVGQGGSFKKQIHLAGFTPLRGDLTTEIFPIRLRES